MVVSVTAALKRFKMEWATQLQPEAIIAACEAAGYTSWRDRVLTPVTTGAPRARRQAGQADARD
jgi:hypothetical protein